jgi:hypothetical protein
MIKRCVGWCRVLTNTMDCAQTKCRGRGALAMVDDREEWEMCEERVGEEGSKGHGLKCMY